MSTTKTEEAVVFITAGNKVEVTRASTVRRLIATKTQHQLVIIDERNQPMIYVIDASSFIQGYEADYGKCDDEATHQALVSAALFRAVLEGKTFKVLSKHALPIDLIK